MTVVDAHQHFWNPEEGSYDWLGPETPAIHRRFGPDDLLPLLAAAGVQRTVLVQSADNRADTDAMFDVAAGTPEVAGIVAWVPLDDPEQAAADLAELRQRPGFVGIRNLIHDRADPDWLLRPDVDAGLGVLEDADVPFDLVAVLPRHLEILDTISERHPQLRIVVDHLGKPPVRGGDLTEWAGLLARAAENPLVSAKVSGLYPTAGDPLAWSAEDLRPAFCTALELFGADRLMYGGDWPISVLHGGYLKVWEELAVLFAELGEADRADVLGGTAAAFYRIPEDRLVSPTGQ